MARIPTYNETPILSGGQISLSAAAAPGLAKAEAGQQMQQLGEQFFKEASQSIKTSTFADMTAKATSEFNDQYSKRMQTMTDANGNPTFEQLPGDVQKIGEDIGNSYASKITDPDVRQKFTINWRENLENRRVTAMGAARNQMMEYQKSALQSSAATMIDQASRAPEDQVQEMKNTLNNSLNSMMQNGAINPQQRDHIMEQFRTQVNANRLNAMIDSSPQMTIARLADVNDPMTKNLRENERQGYLVQAQAAINDREKQGALVDKRVQQRQNELIIGETDRLKAGIDQGTLGQKDIEASFNSGKLGDISTGQTQLRRSQLIDEQTKRAAFNQQHANQSANIASDIAAGVDVNKYNNKTRDQYYQDSLKTLVDHSQGRQIGLEDKAAAIAGSFKAPIPQFQRELDTGMLRGDANDQIAAARSIDYLSSKNPDAIKGVDKTTMAAATMMNRLVKDTNMSYEKAAQQANMLVLHPDPEIMAQRKKNMGMLDGKNQPFSPDNINTYIQGALNKKTDNEIVTPIEMVTGGLVQQNVPVSEGVMSRAKTLMQDAYMRSGNVDDAKKLFENEMLDKFGVSKVNGSATIMYMPPEKAIPGFTADEINSKIKADVPVPQGYNKDTIHVESDAYSVSYDANGKQVISYGLTAEDEHGVRQVLFNPQNGSPLRYTISPDEMTQHRTQMETDAAFQQRQDAITNQANRQKVDNALSGAPQSKDAGAKPADATNNPDFRSEGGPAAIRYNNPGAMGSGASAKKFGAQQDVTLNDGQNNHIAVFPSAVHGAAAQFDLLANKYSDMTVSAIVNKWTGSNAGSGYVNKITQETGLSPDTVVTKEMMQDPKIAIPFAKAMASQEAGKPYPMSDEDWQKGFAMAQSGGDQNVAANQGKSSTTQATSNDIQTASNDNQSVNNNPNYSGALSGISVPADRVAASKGNATVQTSMKDLVQEDQVPTEGHPAIVAQSATGPVKSVNVNANSSYDLAKSMIGLNEHKDREIIQTFIKSSTGRNLNPQRSAWCAAFVNSVLKATGNPETGSFMAKSFLTYGKPTSKPEQGDIVVMERGSSRGTPYGHVAFYAGQSDRDGYIKVLGGNQNDSVSIKEVQVGSVISYRRAPRNPY